MRTQKWLIIPGIVGKTAMSHHVRWNKRIAKAMVSTWIYLIMGKTMWESPYRTPNLDSFFRFEHWYGYVVTIAVFKCSCTSPIPRISNFDGELFPSRTTLDVGFCLILTLAHWYIKVSLSFISIIYYLSLASDIVEELESR